MSQNSSFGSRTTQASAGKSQLPAILLLNAYAMIGSLFVSRAILDALQISSQYWVGRQIFRFTDPFVKILELFPGAERVFIGDLNLADLTLVLAVILFPIGILAFGGRRNGHVRRSG